MFTRSFLSLAVPAALAFVLAGAASARAQAGAEKEIGPAVKTVVDELSTLVNVVEKNAKDLKVKGPQLTTFKGKIDEYEQTAFKAYPQVTAVFRQIYNEQQERYEREKKRVDTDYSTVSGYFERAKQMPGTTELERGYLDSNVDKLKKRHIQTGEFIERLAGPPPAYVDTKPLSKQVGLEAPEESAFLPTGEFAQETVTGYVFILNHDYPRPGQGTLTIQITAGPATLDGGKTLIEDRMTVTGPFRLRSFRITIGKSPSTYRVLFEPSPVRTKP